MLPYASAPAPSYAASACPSKIFVPWMKCFCRRGTAAAVRRGPCFVREPSFLASCGQAVIRSRSAGAGTALLWRCAFPPAATRPSAAAFPPGAFAGSGMRSITFSTQPWEFKCIRRTKSHNMKGAEEFLRSFYFVLPPISSKRSQVNSCCSTDAQVYPASSHSVHVI